MSWCSVSSAPLSIDRCIGQRRSGAAFWGSQPRKPEKKTFVWYKNIFSRFESFLQSLCYLFLSLFHLSVLRNILIQRVATKTVVFYYAEIEWDIGTKKIWESNPYIHIQYSSFLSHAGPIIMCSFGHSNRLSVSQLS